MTVTDYFSKWPESAPHKDKTAVDYVNFLFTVFCRHGRPDTIISDQGREFVNQISRVILNSFMHSNNYYFSAVCLH